MIVTRWVTFPVQLDDRFPPSMALVYAAIDAHEGKIEATWSDTDPTLPLNYYLGHYDAASIKAALAAYEKENADGP